MTTAGLPGALRDLFDHDVPLQVAVDRHFGPGYRQCTNGVWDDRTEFQEHIAHLRTFVRSVEIDVRNEMIDGEHYAERHVARMTKTDGTVVVQEVFVFGTLDGDGRFATVEEVTNMLAGSETDRGIGNARPQQA